jgi:secreted PhoX family phosphatase
LLPISRRQLLRNSAVVGIGFAGLRCALLQREPPFEPGSLVPDPLGVLDLPPGFSYLPISLVGEYMHDGWAVPGKPDGMGAFPGPEGRVILVRNHELSLGTDEIGPFALPNRELTAADLEWLYDPGEGVRPGLGGTTTLLYDPLRGQVERQFLSLAGTYRNCSGGVTPWGSWISCEESVVDAGEPGERDHGYCFEVPSRATGLVEPRPLRALGRFNHEAAAVDARSGVVYLTEDRRDGLFYRFVPNRPGLLEEGGRLEALAIQGQPRADTRNWDRTQFVSGSPAAVEWIPLENVDGPDDLRQRGFEAGAAQFARGEGIWAGDRELYFTCTIGGAARRGQVWRYLPSSREGTLKERSRPGRLELFVEAGVDSPLENPDNITIAPWGELIACEDGPDGDRLIRIGRDGRLTTLARNVYDDGEIAGACFAPDGQTLFLNLQASGLTLAIVGPWPKS